MGRDVRGTGLEVEELSGGDTVKELDKFLVYGVIFVTVLSFNCK